MLTGQIVTNLRVSRGGTEENYEIPQTDRYSNRHLPEWMLESLLAPQF
jgi:hypothetical protein